MLQNLQNVAIFQKFQPDNLVVFEKCCKTRIFLQKSVPIQPETSNILPKFCRNFAEICQCRRRHARQRLVRVRARREQELEPPAVPAAAREAERLAYVACYRHGGA